MTAGPKLSLIIVLLWMSCICTSSYILVPVLVRRGVPLKRQFPPLIPQHRIARRHDPADNNMVEHVRCPPYEPFPCPNDKESCIPHSFVCDGSPDCPDAYDEDPTLCTAVRRPLLGDIQSLLESMASQWKEASLKEIFGDTIANQLQSEAGITKVAIAFIEDEKLDDFAIDVGMSEEEKEDLKSRFKQIANRDFEYDTDEMDQENLHFLQLFIDRLSATEFFD